jgi:hypothetical protein
VRTVMCVWFIVVRLGSIVRCGIAIEFLIPRRLFGMPR